MVPFGAKRKPFPDDILLTATRFATGGWVRLRANDFFFLAARYNYTFVCTSFYTPPPDKHTLLCMRQSDPFPALYLQNLLDGNYIYRVTFVPLTVA